MKVGFIYGYEPSGHSVVAKAISEFLPHDVVDFCFLNLSDIFPDAAKIVVRGYLEIIQKAPALWSYLYDNPFLTFIKKSFGRVVPTAYTRKLEKYIFKNSVDFLVSTHALSSNIADRKIMKISLKRHVAVITDIYAHSFWPTDLDRYFVPHYETYKSLVLNGVNEEKVDIVGMPLRKSFYLTYDQKNVRSKLRIKDRFTILITGGTKGLGDIFSILEVIRNINRKLNVVVLCGSNKSLFLKLKSYKDSANIKVIPLGYHQNPAFLYAASDCVVGKPGGVTIFESAAFAKPFIAWGALPGQEEKNKSFLKKHLYALCPKNERELSLIIENLITNKDFYGKYSRNIRTLHKGDSNIRIVNYIMTNMKG